MDEHREEETIDNKQFSISTKLAVTFLIGWTTTILSIFGTYSSLKSQFKDNDQVNALQDLRIESLKAELQTIRNSVDNNRSRIDDHDKEIGNNSARITILELKEK